MGTTSLVDDGLYRCGSRDTQYWDEHIGPTSEGLADKTTAVFSAHRQL
jgi:hypothetical protein